MGYKGISIGVLFTGLGMFFLLANFVFDFSKEYIYIQIMITFLLVLSGLTTLIKIAGRSNITSYNPSRGSELHFLNSHAYFFVAELAKVLFGGVLILFYPLVGFGLFLFLDCLDGMCLPHEMRSLIVRHRIDKFTDFLCQIPMFVFATQLWPEYLWIFTVFFSLTLVKTLWFVWSGKRNVLIYIPGFFLIFFMMRIIIYQFYPFYGWVFTDLYFTLVILFVTVIVSALYEIIYNGALYRLRYRSPEEELRS